MEKSPKTKKGVRRKKCGSKKDKSTSKVQLVDNTENEMVVAAETTPAKATQQFVSSTFPNQTEEYRMQEWVYYYRFAESDQCVGWGTPHDSPSPVSESRLKGFHNSTPWSPSSDNVLETRKPIRKLISSTELCEVPEFMLELTAMAEKIKTENELPRMVTSEDNSQDTDENSAIEDNLVITISSDSGDIHFTDTQKLQQSCATPAVPDLDCIKQINQESFSSLFEDDVFDEHMIRCSQEVEEKLSKNLKNLNKEQLIYKVDSVSPRQHNRKSPKVQYLSTPKSVKKRLLIAAPSLNTKHVQNISTISLGESEVAMPSVETVNYRYAQSKCSTPKYMKNGRMLGSPSKKVSYKAKTPTSVKKCLLNYKASPSVSTKNNDVQRISTISSGENEEALPSVKIKNYRYAQPKCCTLKYIKDGRILGSVPKKVSHKVLECNKKRTDENVDDSMEAVLQTFVDDDDIELISQAVNAPIPQTSKSSCNKQLQPYFDKRLHQLPSCPSKIPLQKIIVPPQHSRLNQNNIVVPNNFMCSRSAVQVQCEVPKFVPKKSLYSGNMLSRKNKLVVDHLTDLEDGNFLEADVLHFLDTVESTYVSSSPPLQCTPEEIEKKKQEAKQKLEKKRQTTLVGKYELPKNPNSRQLHRPYTKYK